MTPRPQKVSDDDVFAATQRAMERLAPAQLTLAEIAAEAGVTAGALVQRFGSKRALLLALAHRFGGGAKELMDGLRRKHRTPLATLRAYARCMGDLAASPEALARNLAYLQIDLIDPDFRAPLVENARATRAELEALITEAVGKKELVRDVDARSLARTVETIVSGALLTWAVHREGTAASWIVRELDSAIAPYLYDTKAPRKGATKRRH